MSSHGTSIAMAPSAPSSGHVSMPKPIPGGDFLPSFLVATSFYSDSPVQSFVLQSSTRSQWCSEALLGPIRQRVQAQESRTCTSGFPGRDLCDKDIPCDMT